MSIGVGDVTVLRSMWRGRDVIGLDKSEVLRHWLGVWGVVTLLIRCMGGHWLGVWEVVTSLVRRMGGRDFIGKTYGRS